MRLGSSIGRRRPARGGGRKRRSTKGKRRQGSRRRRPARAFTRVLCGAVLLAVMFGLGYVGATRVVFPVPAPPPDLLGVPDLTGLDLQEAAGRAEAAGLGLGAVDSMYHPSAATGSILGQTPLPGQLALPGAAIEFAISLGPEHRAVPDVIGQHEQRARILLGANGFSVAVDSLEDAEPAGEVVAMEPEAGTDVTLPFEVRLAISLGPPVVEMPILLGLSEVEAFLLLDSLGLFVTEIEMDALTGMEPGVVIEQDPAAASTVEVGSEVRLVIGDRELLPGDLPRPDTAGNAGTIIMGANMIRVISLQVRSAGFERPSR